MSKLIRFMYDSLICRLPTFCKAVRVTFAKRLLKFCGKNVNIKRGAKFGDGVILGDDSDFGINARIGAGTQIGKHVLMGPDVRIYTQNHVYLDSSIPIKYQGVTDIEPVIIGDDVWIGGGCCYSTWGQDCAWLCNWRRCSCYEKYR